MRLIDADELKNYADLVVSKHKDEDFYESLLSAYITMLLELCSIIDAEPVRHGRWKMRKNWTHMVCSACSFEVPYDIFNYCPNCGAKMGEVIEDA